jgi:hypothetical protein
VAREDLVVEKMVLEVEQVMVHKVTLKQVPVVVAVKVVIITVQMF